MPFSYHVPMEKVSAHFLAENRNLFWRHRHCRPSVSWASFPAERMASPPEGSIAAEKRHLTSGYGRQRCFARGPDVCLEPSEGNGHYGCSSGLLMIIQANAAAIGNQEPWRAWMSMGVRWPRRDLSQLCQAPVLDVQAGDAYLQSKKGLCGWPQRVQRAGCRQGPVPLDPECGVRRLYDDPRSMWACCRAGEPPISSTLSGRGQNDCSRFAKGNRVDS